MADKFATLNYGTGKNQKEIELPIVKGAVGPGQVAGEKGARFAPAG